MVAGFQRTRARVALVVVLLIVVLFAQNAAASLAPTGASAQTGRLVGRAGFAYLSGMRTFAAALLWNRLDPQFDLYYHDRGLAEDTQMIPTMWLVVTLDPQFVQAYYNSSWIVARHGDYSTSFDLARRGIANNPKSGLLRASYIELMFLRDKKKYGQAAAAQAEAGTAPGVMWKDDAEKGEGYAVFAAAYHVAGLATKEKAARAVTDELFREVRSNNATGTSED